jgi:hypothetical protein
MAIGLTKLARCFGVSPKPVEDLRDRHPHDAALLEQRGGLRFEGTEFSRPAEPEAQRCVEDSAGIERQLGAIVVNLALGGVRAVGAGVVAGRACTIPVSGQARASV